MIAPDFDSLAQRLEEAADRLAEDLPEGVVAPQFLEGDPSLDEVDAYCVDLMREAAGAVVVAPCLLEALKGAIGALEFSLDYHRDLGNEDIAFAADRLDAARAAILKATGASL
jgi:hypothetical protein